jgi:hypothetical protein
VIKDFKQIRKVFPLRLENVLNKIRMIYSSDQKKILSWGLPKMKNILIASGGTSNLATSLVLCGGPFMFYAISRASSNENAVRGMKALGVRFVPSESHVPDVHRILWLSPHDDVKRLEYLAQIAPTLVMSSGAVMGFLCGKESEDALSPYQKAKLSVLRAKNVTKFIPGFFIEDMILPHWASNGLHGETTKRIFDIRDNDNDGFNWGKQYSVTPKSFICSAIQKWTTGSEVGVGSVINDCENFFAVCSDREYCRWELREFSSLPAPQKVKLESPPIYRDCAHIDRLHEEMIVLSCIKAQELNSL